MTETHLARRDAIADGVVPDHARPARREATRSPSRCATASSTRSATCRADPAVRACPDHRRRATRSARAWTSAASTVAQAGKPGFDPAHHRRRRCASACRRSSASCGSSTSRRSPRSTAPRSGPARTSRSRATSCSSHPTTKFIWSFAQVGPRRRRRRRVPPPPPRRPAARQGDGDARRGLRPAPRPSTLGLAYRCVDDADALLPEAPTRSRSGSPPGPTRSLGLSKRLLNASFETDLAHVARARRALPGARHRVGRPRRGHGRVPREARRQVRRPVTCRSERRCRTRSPSHSRSRRHRRAGRDRRGPATLGRRTRRRPLDLARPRILAAGADLDVVRARLDREPYRTIFRPSSTSTRRRPTASRPTTTRSARSASRPRPPRTWRSSTRSTAPSSTARSSRSRHPRRAPPPATPSATTCSPCTPGAGSRSPRRSAAPTATSTPPRSCSSTRPPTTRCSARGTTSAPSDATIRTNITDLAAELYRNYTVPDYGQQLRDRAARTTTVRSPRRRSASRRSRCSIPRPPRARRRPTTASPAAWLTFALDQVDLVQRWTFVAPGGGYGEGPVLPALREPEPAPVHPGVGPRPRQPRVGHRRRDRSPTSGSTRRTAQTQRWMLDMTLPNGGLAPDRRRQRRLLVLLRRSRRPIPTDAAAFAWRWANAPTPYDTDGSVDLAADALANLRRRRRRPRHRTDRRPASTTSPAPRCSAATGAPTRSQVVAVGEHGAAMELGRDREGLGQVGRAPPTSSPTPRASSLARVRRAAAPRPRLPHLRATRTSSGKAPDHNLILVNGKGPADPFFSSIFWVNDRAGLPPDLDGAGHDHRRLATRRPGTGPRSPARTPAPQFQRRFEFVDDRYLVTFDAVTATPGDALTWVTHGNGGGTSGGTFTRGRRRRPLGARRGARRHRAGDRAPARSRRPPATPTTKAAGRVLTHPHHARHHRDRTVTATTRSVGIAYPTRIGDAAPTDRVAAPTPATVASDSASPTPPATAIVVATQYANGRITIRDRHLDGTPRSINRDERPLGVGTERPDASPHDAAAGSASASAPDTVDVVAPKTDVELHGLPFVPRRADGACNLTHQRDRHLRAHRPATARSRCAPSPGTRRPPPIRVRISKMRRGRHLAAARRAGQLRREPRRPHRALAARRRAGRQRVGRSPEADTTRPWLAARRGRPVPRAPRRHRLPRRREPLDRRHGLRRTALRRRPPHLVRPPLLRPSVWALGRRPGTGSRGLRRPARLRWLRLGVATSMRSTCVTSTLRQVREDVDGSVRRQGRDRHGRRARHRAGRGAAARRRGRGGRGQRPRRRDHRRGCRPAARAAGGRRDRRGRRPRPRPTTTTSRLERRSGARRAGRRHLRWARRGDQQRRDPPGQDELQHGRGGVGRRHRRAPQGPLHHQPVRGRVLAAAQQGHRRARRRRDRQHRRASPASTATAGR